jgi:hypothetical protein
MCTLKAAMMPVTVGRSGVEVCNCCSLSRLLGWPYSTGSISLLWLCLAWLVIWYGNEIICRPLCWNNLVLSLQSKKSCTAMLRLLGHVSAAVLPGICESGSVRLRLHVDAANVRWGISFVAFVSKARPICCFSFLRIQTKLHTQTHYFCFQWLRMWSLSVGHAIIGTPSKLPSNDNVYHTLHNWRHFSLRIIMNQCYYLCFKT